MTDVLDPDVLTGFHDGPVYYSAEDGRFYLLTDDGAIPADGPRYATTLDAAQLSMCGADHFTLRSDGTVDMMRPASPYTAAYEDTIMGMHFPGGLGLMGASGSSSLRKRLALNFLSGGSLDPRITFTRASSATRVNSSGLIETVSSNVARIDYDPVTLAPKGLLIEEQRTNLLLRSTWEGGTAGVEGSGAVAPTGWSFAATTGSVSYPTSTLYPSATAIRFVAAAQRPIVAQNVTLLANTTYSQSVYVEAVDGGASILSDNIGASLPSGTTTYYIDGVVVSSATVLTAGKRVVAVHAVGGTGGSAQIRYGLGVSGAATGDVTLSCPQLEAGAF